MCAGLMLFLLFEGLLSNETMKHTLLRVYLKYQLSYAVSSLDLKTQRRVGEDYDYRNR